MTQKDILTLATNPELIALLTEITEINSNMNSKTIYEQKTATKKMKTIAKQIADTIKYQKNAE